MKKIFNLLLGSMICFVLVGCSNSLEDDAKKNLAERSTEAAVKAGEVYYMSEIAKGNTVTNPLEITAANLKVDNKPSDGKVTVTVSADGQTVTVTATDLVFDEYICQYKDEKATCKKK